MTVDNNNCISFFGQQPVGPCCARYEHGGPLCRMVLRDSQCGASHAGLTPPLAHHPPAPQLCHLLRLRAIAVISSEPEFDKTALWLRSLGAAEVLLDSGSLKVGGAGGWKGTFECECVVAWRG